MSVLRRIALPVLSAALLALSVAGVFGYLHAGGMPATIFLSAFAPYLLLLALPALAGFLVGRRRWAAIPAVAVLVFFVVVQAPLWTATDAPRGGRSMTVMTSNLKIGGADPAAVVRAVTQRHVDVLMLEELTPSAERRLAAAGLDRTLRYRIAHPGPTAKGTGLWSRYPLTEVPWPALSFQSVVARAAVPGMRTEPLLVALHVGGPVPDAGNWREDLRRLPIKFGKIARQAGGAPIVVGGDFNATHSVPQFRRLLTDGYADAAGQAGAGSIRTYPADTWYPPLLGIDHVLTRGGVARSADTVTIPGSDHRALVVRLRLSG